MASPRLPGPMTCSPGQATAVGRGGRHASYRRSTDSRPRRAGKGRGRCGGAAARRMRVAAVATGPLWCRRCFPWRRACSGRSWGTCEAGETNACAATVIPPHARPVLRFVLVDVSGIRTYFHPVKNTSFPRAAVMDMLALSLPHRPAGTKSTTRKSSDEIHMFGLDVERAHGGVGTIHALFGCQALEAYESNG